MTPFYLKIPMIRNIPNNNNNALNFHKTMREEFLFALDSLKGNAETLESN